MGNNLLWVSHEDTKYYSYNELPKDIFMIVEDFKNKVEKEGIDSSIIEDSKYIIFDDPRVSHGGFGYYKVPVVGLRISPNMNYFQKKQVIWHEFGHIIMGYGHEDKTNHIMNYSTTMNYQNQKFLEKSFFTKDVPYFNYKTGFKSSKHHLEKVFIDLLSNVYLYIAAIIGLLWMYLWPKRFDL